MCSKADTIARARLLRCGHRSNRCTPERDWPPSAETAHAQGVDPEPACPETTTLRVGHEPGIRGAAGEPVRPGAGLGIVHHREGSGREG